VGSIEGGQAVGEAVAPARKLAPDHESEAAVGLTATLPGVAARAVPAAMVTKATAAVRMRMFLFMGPPRNGPDLVRLVNFD
jgi:hypothetical protein